MRKKLRIILYVLLGGLILALMLLPAFPYIFRSIGRYEFTKAGEYTTRLAEFREARGGSLSGPDYDEAQDLENLKDTSWKRAVKAFSLASDMNPSVLNDDDFVSLGEARLRSASLGQVPPSLPFKATDEITRKIIADAEAALRLNPKSKGAYNLMIYTYRVYNTAAGEKTLEACERAKTVLPDDLDLQHSCAMMVVDDDESKKRILMKIVELDPTNTANFSLAWILEREQKFDEGIELLENMLDNNPELYLRRRAEDNLERLRHYKETRKRNQAALAENPDDIEAAKALADLYRWRNESLALRWNERAYELDPDDEDVISSLAYQRENAGDVDGAAELYEKKLKNAKKAYSRDMAIEDLAELYIRVGDMEQGMAWSEKLDPESRHAIRLVHEIASYYRVSGDDVLAYKYSEESVRLGRELDRKLRR